MPTSPGVSRKYPQCYPAPRKFGLVVGCVDCRLLDDLVRFLDHDNLTNRYYQATFAGCAIGLSAKAPTYYPARDPHGNPVGPPLDFGHWKQTLLAHLKVVLKLTGGDLTDVYIVEHTDCGAYREFLGADYYADPAHPDTPAERDAHAHYARSLAEELVAWFQTDEAREWGRQLGRGDLRTPLVRGFLMNLRGDVELLFGADETTEAGLYQ
ncbi:MAG: hypothetical protein K2V38_06575 [Gemmataceae bacterium]|nr:hypothetical protein [Gemmataceae bacterium]